MKLHTKRGYNPFEVASCLQKAIRRGDTALAGYMAIEMFESGFANYCWKRLLTISAEDCAGIITQEIKALTPLGMRIAAPKFANTCWRAERDGSIRCDTGYVPCEFVSPVLYGDEGLGRRMALPAARPQIPEQMRIVPVGVILVPADGPLRSLA